MADTQGWHKDSKGHAKAAKGESIKNTDKGQGWHGDSKGPAKAAKDENKDTISLTNKLMGK